MPSRIIKAISGFYYVLDGDQLIECRARGSFRKDGATILVGDFVEYDKKQKVINSILPRKNYLSRPPVANVDKAFIVSSYITPQPNNLLIDTMIAICEYKNITPIIVFNKCDLGDFEEIEACYKKAGYKVIITSAQDGDGMSLIEDELAGCVSVFTGNSGVGKSSILNIIMPQLKLATGQTSEKLGRGRHTTRHTELYFVKDGIVADTPGFSSLEVDKNDYSFKEHLADCFIEFADFTDKCQFTGCSHTGEKGCQVCKAVADGKIDKKRWESYKTLYNELKNIKKWQIK